MKLAPLALIPLIFSATAQISAAEQTIVIRPDTKYVNVQLGDVVTFVVGGRTFTFNFDDPNYWPVNLSRAAPAGMLNHRVIAYVSPFRQDFGRDDDDD